MADIPGIIEGAAEGKGLGLRFLRHIERNSLLLFMIPADADSIAEEYKVLLNELTQFNPELLDKDRIVAVSKADLLDEEMMEQMRSDFPKDVECLFISAVTGAGIVTLKDHIWRKLQR